MSTLTIAPLPAPPRPTIPEPPPAAPLLPNALLAPLALLWLWILPVGILLLLNVQGYHLVSGNMDAAQLHSAHLVGLAGAANLTLGLALFAATTWLRRQPFVRPVAHTAWSVPAFAILAQLAYLWCAVSSGESAIPRSVALWIYPPQRFLFNQFAFAMLPLALGVLRLACLNTDAAAGRSLAAVSIIGVGAPILLYSLFFVVGSGAASHFTPVLFVTAVVVLGLFMFVGLVRVLLLLLRKLSAYRAAAERLAIFLVAFVLPLSGLMLNRSIPFPTDFQATEIYALVAANTAILLFASFSHVRRPVLSFALLSATLPFSLYFFLVFLPYTPLSILAVIVFGLGFLVLCPTLLFVLHLHLLHSARRNPLLSLRPAQLTLVGVTSFLILPGFFAARAFADRTALHAALDYVYSPAIRTGDLTYPGSLKHLRRALASHRSYKNGLHYPLLSDFYAWLVFNDLVLPDDKLARLETTFFGTAGSTANTDPLRRNPSAASSSSSVRERTRMPRVAALPQNVAVTALAVRTAPAGDRNTTVTLVLTLANTTPDSRPGAVAEYLATLPLPSGVFVNGFRLHLAGTPVPGRIFEKKTALWVYTMIRDSERRDPGLLFYRTPTELELRVFPVVAGTPSTVELDFLLPVPAASLPLDDLALSALRDPAAVLVRLGTRLPPQLTRTAHGTAVAGDLASLRLPSVERPPYLHVIVDRSLDHGFTGDLASALQTLRTRFPTARSARVTLAHHDITDLVTPRTPIEELLAFPAPPLTRTLPLSGGFALDLALAHALRQHRDFDLDHAPSTSQPPPRPIFVILSRHAAPRTVSLDRTAEWADLVPQLELHELAADGTFLSHLAPASSPAPLLRLGPSVRTLVSARAPQFEPTTLAPLLESYDPAVAAWRQVPDVTTQTDTPWSQAVSLHLRQHDHARSPGDSDPRTTLASLVDASRASGLLLASTSYLVVENSAQWRMLERSENQKLSQNAALAFRETPAPPALWLVLAFLLWLAHRHRTRHATSLPAPPLPSLSSVPPCLCGSLRLRNFPTSPSSYPPSSPSHAPHNNFHHRRNTSSTP